MIMTFNRNASLLKASLIFIGFSIGIVIILTLDYWKDNSHTYSMVFCSYYLFILYTLWIIGNRRIQPYILFYLTFGLFIGGRFWANLLGYKEDIWKSVYFFSYHLNKEDKVLLLKQVIGFICCSSIGYWLSKCTRQTKAKLDINLSQTTNKLIDIMLNRLYILFFAYAIFLNIKKLKEALQYGYLSLYIGKQSNDFSTGASLFYAVMNICLGIAMGYGNKSNRRNYLILMIINSLFMIVIGSRSAFGATMLVLLWLYSQYHKINLKKTLLLCCLCMLLLLTVFTFSLRSSEIGLQTNAWDILLAFIYDQGISLMVFDASKLIDSYPIMPYFTSLFPGIPGLSKFLTGETYSPFETSFSGYMCVSLNPEMYFNGHALGWTILSDIYLFSFRIFPLFLLLSIGWGYLIGKLESLAEHNAFFKSYMYIIISGLLMSPRASVQGIIPYIFYLISSLIIIVFFIQSLKSKNDRHCTPLG